jgi:hypothetical protein
MEDSERPIQGNPPAIMSGISSRIIEFSQRVSDISKSDRIPIYLAADCGRAVSRLGHTAARLWSINGWISRLTKVLSQSMMRSDPSCWPIALRASLARRQFFLVTPGAESLPVFSGGTCSQTYPSGPITTTVLLPAARPADAVALLPEIRR